MSILTVQHLEKHFENTKVLNDISFSLEEGQAPFHHRLLRQRQNHAAAVSELSETPDAGTITVQDKVLFDADHHANCSEKGDPEKPAPLRHGVPVLQPFPQYTALKT